MNGFASGFLDAPLLSDVVIGWIPKVRRRSSLERELAMIGDRELGDLGISRAELMRVARSGG